MVGGRATFRTLSPVRIYFQMGLTSNPIYERCLEEDESASYILSDCEAVASHHLGYYFKGSGDYQYAPLKKMLHFDC
jgi:hypothetical protein